MMLMTGIGLLAAAAPVPEALADPSSPDPPADPLAGPAAPADPPAGPPAPDPPPPAAQTGTYVFADEFDGPAGAPPDYSKWTVFNWPENVVPPILGVWRDDRRNVFLDGNSNLVLCATQEGSDYFSGKIQSLAKVGINHTWEARIKLNCLTPGCWPSFWMVNEEPLPDGEIDVVEWYGNGKWAPGSTVHARSDGKTWSGRDIPELVDAAWHTWRCQWTDTGFRFSRDGKPYLSVPATPIKGVWPFNQPGYLLSTLFSLAVGGPGGGDPARGALPATMLIDWIHIW